MAHWDTGLLIFLKELHTFCSRQKIDLNCDGLPEGARKLLELASAVPEKTDARKPEGRVRFSRMWATKPSISSSPQVICWGLSGLRPLPF